MLKIRQLQKKKQEELAQAAQSDGSAVSTSKHVSAAQLRLQKDINELALPNSIKLYFPDPSNLFEFSFSIVPQEGYYKNGTFRFSTEISNSFPIEPPKIRCLNKIYHPNIDIEGNICLNILREDWSPVLSLNSVLIGLNFLLLEPNPNDPLNKDAANVFVKNPNLFTSNVRTSMRGGYVDGEYYDKIV